MESSSGKSQVDPAGDFKLPRTHEGEVVGKILDQADHLVARSGGIISLAIDQATNVSGRPTAAALLAAAGKHMAARAATYDKPEGERSMAKTVEAFNAITGQDLTEAQGWLLMQVLKSVRLFQRPGYHADSAEDGIAYAALLAEAKAKESPLPAAPSTTCGSAGSATAIK